MDDRTAVLFSALAGALIGGACGFLFLTDRGRRIREDLEPRLTEVVNEFQRLRLTADQARHARRGWRDDQPFSARS